MLYYSLIHALDGAVGIDRDLYAICTSLLGNNDQNRKESNFINMHTKKENNCKKQKKNPNSAYNRDDKWCELFANGKTLYK